MPDPAKLRAGDRIRLLTVPAADLAQRNRELRDGMADAGWTADTLERIILEQPVVTISSIDEYGLPWFEVRFSDNDYHSIAVMDSESWEYAE